MIQSMGSNHLSKYSNKLHSLFEMKIYGQYDYRYYRATQLFFRVHQKLICLQTNNRNFNDNYHLWSVFHTAIFDNNDQAIELIWALCISLCLWVVGDFHGDTMMSMHVGHSANRIWKRTNCNYFLIIMLIVGRFSLVFDIGGAFLIYLFHN